MDPDQWQRVKVVYQLALDRAPDEQAPFLEQTCKDEPEILQEVQSLLAQESDSFLERASREATEPRGEAAAASEPAAIEETPAEPPTKAAPGCRHPFVWVIWLALAGLTAVFVYAAWKIPQDTADFGWSEAQRGARWEVTAVSPGGPAEGELEPGDVLVGLNGDANVARVGTEAYRLSVKIGQQYHVQVRRGQATLEYELSPVGRHPDLGALIFGWVLSLIWCATGVFIGFARPQEGMARLAFAAAALTGFVYLNVGLLPTLYALQPLHVVFGYHFFYRFPGQPPRARAWRVLLWLLYLGTAVFVARELWIKFAWFAQGPRAVTALQASPLAGVLDWVGFAIGLTALLGAPVIAVHKYLVLTDRDLRRRFQWVFLGGVVGLVPPAVQVALDPIRSNPAVAAWLLPGDWWLVFNIVTDGCSIAIPLSVAYVVVKHGVFGIQVVIRRGLQYLFARRALQVLLALPVGALLYTLVSYRHHTLAELVTETRGYLFWILALGLSLRYRAPLLRWLDQKFFREQIDSEQVVLGLVDQIGRFDSAEQVSEFVRQQLESSLHPKSMYLWWRKGGVMTLASGPDHEPDSARLPISGAFLEHLKRRGSMARVPLAADSGALAADSRWLAKKGVRLIVPMVGRERFEGLLMLGEKRSEEAYSTSDENLLHAVSQATAMMLDNLELKERLMDEQHIRHEVLAKLDRRLVNLMQECPACGACYDQGVEKCGRDGSLLTLTLPVARIIDDKYRLDRLIGRGGMGAVYAARDLRLEREVAVKVMLGGAFGHETALRRFRREAQAVARLNHPNIVALYDFGELEGGGAYLVMEHIRGETLRTEMKRTGAFPLAETAVWFDQMLDGVAAAHEQGVVHRDFKPENILGVRRAPGALAVKILDFGLAKIRPHPATTPVSQSLTESGVVLGTLAYMAPEQLLGREVDASADVYSAGVILVEMLTGGRPFADEADRRHEYHLPGGTPNHTALDAVLQRCVALAPDERFPSAAELRSALLPALRAGQASHSSTCGRP